jgi:transcriptional regulator with XRE-family HTH domain
MPFWHLCHFGIYAILAYTTLMSPAQFAKLLDAAGMTRREAAEALDMKERQVYRYLSGESEIPRVVEYALRWILQKRKE